jgi:O-antigen/teichoic acid export membrane protein
MSEQSDMTAGEDAAGMAGIAPMFGSLASGVAVTLVTRLVGLACVLGSSVIIARWLGPAGTGALALLNVTVALGLQLGSAGMPSATTYFIAKQPSILATAWTNGLMFSFAAGALITAGVVAIANLRPTIFNGVPPRLVTIVAISIPFQLVSLLGLNLLLAIDRIRLMNLLDALSSLLIFGNVIGVLVLWRRDLTMLVWFNTASSVVLSVLLIWSIGRVTRHKRSVAAALDLSLLVKMLIYGLKFYLCIFAGFLIIRADLLIVNRFRGAEAAGVYAIASQFSFLLIMLPAVIASLLFPRVAARQNEPAAYAVEVTRHTSFVMLVICLGAALAAFALPLVYGPRFADATVQFLILLPGVFFISLESVLVQYFTGTGLPRQIPAFWIVTVTVNLALNLALVPVWGARAAAIDSTISYVLIFILVTGYFWRRTGYNPLMVLTPRAPEFRILLARLQRRAFAK